MKILKCKEPKWLTDDDGMTSHAKVETCTLGVHRYGKDFSFERSNEQYAFIRGIDEGLRTMEDAQKYALEVYQHDMQRTYEAAFERIETMERMFS